MPHSIINYQPLNVNISYTYFVRFELFSVDRNPLTMSFYSYLRKSIRSSTIKTRFIDKVWLVKVSEVETTVTARRSGVLKPSFSNSHCSSENRSIGNLQMLRSRETRGEFAQNIFVSFQQVPIIRHTFKCGLRKPCWKCGNGDLWWLRVTVCRNKNRRQPFRI